MNILNIIRESEKEHADTCKAGEWRYAKLTDREVAQVEQRLAGRKLTGWVATVDLLNGKAFLRYTKCA